jgi:hypothetical protein
MGTDNLYTCDEYEEAERLAFLASEFESLK